FVTAVATGFALIETRAVWAHLPWWGNVAVLVVVPAGLATLLRRARVEGRTPYLAAIGWLGMLTAPHGGRTLSGSGPRPGRPVRAGGWAGFSPPSGGTGTAAGAAGPLRPSAPRSVADLLATAREPGALR
ncbi:MAG: hypothetical protein L0Y54_03405, partial [Sporichthyaceae bacterium]|nr:hypothetical protein [Sporichthyaceae bacterium]